MTDHLRVTVLFDTAGFQRSLPLTGAAARTLHLNRHLAEAGVEVILLLCDLNPRSASTGLWPFAVRYLTYREVYEDTAGLTAQVRETAPDVLVMSNTQLTVRYGRKLADAAGAALVYEMHDDEAMVSRSIGLGEWEWRQAAILQATAVAAADATIVFTPRDADRARSLRAKDVHVVPCAVEPGPPPEHSGRSGRSAAFVGNLYYEPNARAAVFLSKRLAPAVGRRAGRIHVYGRYPRHLRALGKAGPLLLHGPVANLRSALDTAGMGLAPLDSGGGMKLKVLQYMAAGLPVIGTPEAFTGLPDPASYALVSRDARMADIPDLADRLFDDPQLSEDLGHAGRSLVEAAYSWAAVARTALSAYTTIASSPAAATVPWAPTGDVKAFAARPPYWLKEWRTQQEPTMGSKGTPFAADREHPVLARLATEIDCARQAAESGLDTSFDAEAIVGYGGRSMVFLGKTAVLKIYTHRPVERMEREISGLRIAQSVPGLRVPEVLGHGKDPGSLTWVSTTRLDGTAPARADDEEETRLLGAVAARLHAIPAQALAGTAPFRRNIRPLPDGAPPIAADLSTTVTSLEGTQRAWCVPGFVHGDYSGRNLLLSDGLVPGVIDFEGFGFGCVYDDLTNMYVQNCLIDGRDPQHAIVAYETESARLGQSTAVDVRHLLFHVARYFRWVLQWAAEIDPHLTQQVTALAPQVLVGLDSERPVLR